MLFSFSDENMLREEGKKIERQEQSERGLDRQSFRHVLAWIRATYSVQEQQTNGVSEPMHEQVLIIGADDWRRLAPYQVHDTLE